MKQTTLFVDEHGFHGLELLCEFSCGDVRIYIENLSVIALSKTAQDGQCTSTDGRFNGPLVYSSDLTDQAILVGIERGGSEDTRSDRTGTRPVFLERADELQVFLEENTTGNLERFCVCKL